MAISASLEEFLELTLYINPVMFLLMFLHAKWPPEQRNHHTTDDRDWSWRAPDLSIMMSKLCSYMSTGCSVKWYIKHFKTTLNALPDGNWEKNQKKKHYSWCEGKFWTTNEIVTCSHWNRSMCQHNVTREFLYFGLFLSPLSVSKYNYLWSLHLTIRKRHENLINFNFQSYSPAHIKSVNSDVNEGSDWPTVTTVINMLSGRQKSVEETDRLWLVRGANLDLCGNLQFLTFFYQITKIGGQDGEINEGFNLWVQVQQRVKETEKDSLCW